MLQVVVHFKFVMLCYPVVLQFICTTQYYSCLNGLYRPTTATVPNPAQALKEEERETSLST